MNEKTLEFINSIGVMTETWMVIYQAFLSRGISQDEAMMHTKGLYETIFKTTFDKTNEKNNGEE